MPSFPCFGLTGGVASGKSSVASFFAALGAKVIDADRIAHDMLRRRGPAFDEVFQHFGQQVLNASGEIDRKLLGRIVFRDSQERRTLEAILHPLIIAKQEELAVQYHQESPKAVILIEATLIYEAGIEDRFSKIVVAWCAPAQQIERIMAKGELSREEAAARVATQIPAEEKRRRASFVIDCSESLDQTRAQVVDVYSQLQRIVLG